MKLTTDIAVSESDIRIKDIIKLGSEAPIEQRIAAQVLLEDQIGQLKAINDSLKEQIRTTKYNDIVNKLVSSGKIPSKDSKPVFKISTKYGDTIKVFINADVDSGFTISDKISEKEIIDSVVPDKYKKVTTSLDKKAIEADFNAGTLPDVLKTYCSKAPIEITKLRKSIVKGGK